MLLEAIMSIELQDLPRQEFELIIVDNSDDLQARDRFRDGLQITCAHRYLDEARPGLSRARNIGIHAARAELVAFLDDDAKASAGWLRHIIEAFSTNEAAGVVGGPVRPIWAARCPDWLTPQLQGFLTIIDRGDEARLLAGEEWLSGTNIAFRTRAVSEAGLFPENLGRIRASYCRTRSCSSPSAYEISATRYSMIQRSKCIIASIPIGSASPGCDAGCFGKCCRISS
jgi:cellulose synthase/poly-beta-1,6-N-acetylglucosamine synthase-like glycosyltransferase